MDQTDLALLEHWTRLSVFYNKAYRVPHIPTTIPSGIFIVRRVPYFSPALAGHLVLMSLLVVVSASCTRDPFGLDAEPHYLVGKPAPLFVTDDLKKNSFDLSQHVGKHVVLFDFWATWCGPCVEALPRIAAVAKAREDTGLKFYAVNVGEDRNTIQEFLSSMNLQVDVLRDVYGEISSLYQAEAIPQTVVIGVDGTVRAVHVGFDAGTEKQLAAELDALLREVENSPE